MKRRDAGSNPSGGRGMFDGMKGEIERRGNLMMREGPKGEGYFFFQYSRFNEHLLLFRIFLWFEEQIHFKLRRSHLCTNFGNWKKEC